MNFREPLGGHLGVSLLVAVLSIPAAMFLLPLETRELLIVPPLIFLGGLFPDLDTHSTPSKWAARIFVVASIYLIYIDQPLYAALIGIAFMLTKVGKHRGWTHSFLLIIALPFFGQSIGLFLPFTAFAIGVLSHVIADDIYSRIKKSKHF